LIDDEERGQMASAEVLIYTRDGRLDDQQTVRVDLLSGSSRAQLLSSFPQLREAARGVMSRPLRLILVSHAMGIPKNSNEETELLYY
jgi:hypothetical protein